MLKILKLAGSVIFLCLFLAVVTMLELPSLPVSILASLLAAFLIYRSNFIPRKQGLIAVGMVLCVWIIAFEYVPPGQLTSEKKLNGVPLQEIAGKYYLGDGLGLNWYLDISPAGRFCFLWRGCLGIYDRKKGWIEATNDSLIFHPNLNFLKMIRGTRSASMEMIPVRWGDRVYLIQKEKMVEFCSEINLGMEPRRDMHGQYYLREKDLGDPPEGRPQLPSQWRKYILDAPVRGHVVQLVDSRKGLINVGSRSGLLPGMILYANDTGSMSSGMVIIRSVVENSSLVEYLYEKKRLVVGQGITTAFFDPLMSSGEGNK